MAERRENRVPIIAVGVLVFNSNGLVLLGERIEAFGRGTIGLPGGKVNKNETFAEAAVRETGEEAGILESDLVMGEYISVSYENIMGYDGLTVGVKAFTNGEPNNGNDEIGNWAWYSLDSLPDNLFPPSKRILENYKRGVVRDKQLPW